MGPCIVVTGALVVPLYLKAPRLFIAKVKKDVAKKESTPSEDDAVEEIEEVMEAEEKEPKNPFPLVLSIATMAFGTFVFVFYFIKYIKSYYGYEDGSAVGYDFDPDSMLIFILGIFLALLGVLSLNRYIRDKFSYIRYSGVLTILSIIDLIYCVARLIRMYVKEKDPFTYWVWLVIGGLIFAGCLTWFIITVVRFKKQKSSQI